MKKSLRILALLVIVATATTWLVTGANRGWTKTSVAVKTLDEVTGIEGITYQKKFLPGVDFLALGFGGGAAFFVSSFFFRKPNNKQNTNQTNN